MQPAPQWTEAVERSCSAVVAAVQSAGRGAEAELFWDFLRQGGHPPAGSLPPRPLPPPAAAAAAAAEDEYVYMCVGTEETRMSKESDFVEELGEESEESEERRIEIKVSHASVYPARAGLRSCSVGDGIAVCLAAQGTVLCDGDSDAELGTLHGDDALTAARLPWPAAAVRCGSFFGAALRRGGAGVCTWGIGAGADRFHGAPAEVDGLPAGDPVVILEAGEDFVIVITASDAAYGWGSNGYSELALRPDGWHSTPVRIAELSGRRIRRLACDSLHSLAETEAGALLTWGGREWRPRRVPADGMAFPLRSMCAGARPFAVADAAGRVWTSKSVARPEKMELAELPGRMVRVAAAAAYIEKCPHFIVALSECGELWDCTNRRRCRQINPGWLPLGLLPCGGPTAYRVLLLPDLSCGRARLKLFARVAVRLELPSDPLRSNLTPFAVDDCYLSGAEHDPFGWPAAEARGSAAD